MRSTRQPRTGTCSVLRPRVVRTSFQCIVHLVPERFGFTELLLGPAEQISAWCYEDGYLTYATDENAAAIMYAETGSLRELRSQIRRRPGFDPALQMISGPSLFHYDHQVRGPVRKRRRRTGGSGRGCCAKQPGRASRRNLPTALTRGLADSLAGCVGSSLHTFDGESVLETCQRRAGLMVRTLLRAMP